MHIMEITHVHVDVLKKNLSSVHMFAVLYARV